MTGSLRLAEAVLEFLFECELALLVALQGGSIWKGGSSKHIQGFLEAYP